MALALSWPLRSEAVDRLVDARNQVEREVARGGKGRVEGTHFKAMTRFLRDMTTDDEQRRE